jgi:hypothetical protein
LRQNGNDCILPVDIDFHHLSTFDPNWVTLQYTWKESKEKTNAKTARARLRLYDPPFNAGPFGRQFDSPPDPIDSDGFLFPLPHYRPYGEGE